MRVWVLLLKIAAVVALQPPAARRPQPTVRREAFGRLKNPFDRRPGATVGKVQIALANEKGQASKFVAEEVQRFNSRTARGVANFVSSVCTGLCRRDSSWLYAACEGQFFGGGEVERSEHERYYNRLVNAEAAKFEKEYLPTAADIAREDQLLPGGICVVSIVVALEGNLDDLFLATPSSAPSLRNILYDLASAVEVDEGEELYNAEVLWTPSSPSETLLREDMLIDFPELLAI
ncbi:hypothetical protein CTAYLR_004695 [Chrysophaeum taylorii]|uniref:Uncharacterized protein n=1 Tax=Chrysophaeum taylorii TaxID=2483200 RepID=A0AAD7U7F5_9STRA|nr:hypothetical protein CTAYLR_004695 [Chrysophaeum taylorii]